MNDKFISGLSTLQRLYNITLYTSTYEDCIIHCTVFVEIFGKVLFSYNSNNQEINENITYSKISRVIAKFDAWSLAVILPLDRYGVASFL